MGLKACFMPLSDVACAKTRSASLQPNATTIGVGQPSGLCPEMAPWLLKCHGSNGDRGDHRGHRYLDAAADS